MVIQSVVKKSILQGKRSQKNRKDRIGRTLKERKKKSIRFVTWLISPTWSILASRQNAPWPCWKNEFCIAIQRRTLRQRIRKWPLKESTCVKLDEYNSPRRKGVTWEESIGRRKNQFARKTICRHAKNIQQLTGSVHLIPDDSFDGNSLDRRVPTRIRRYEECVGGPKVSTGLTKRP